MKDKLKKGDKVVCITDEYNLKKGKTYTIKKVVDEDFVDIGEEYNYFAFCFKKKINLRKVKPLTEMNLINAREDVNAEKIQEIILELNKLIDMHKEES